MWTSGLTRKETAIVTNEQTSKANAFSGIYHILQPLRRLMIWKTGFGNVWATKVSTSYEWWRVGLRLTVYDNDGAAFSQQQAHSATVCHPWFHLAVLRDQAVPVLKVSGMPEQRPPDDTNTFWSICRQCVPHRLHWRYRLRAS